MVYLSADRLLYSDLSYGPDMSSQDSACKQERWWGEAVGLHELRTPVGLVDSTHVKGRSGHWLGAGKFCAVA